MITLPTGKFHLPPDQVSDERNRRDQKPGRSLRR